MLVSYDVLISNKQVVGLYNYWAVGLMGCNGDGFK